LRENGRRIQVVTGYFDPLLAAHAERLEEIRATADALMVLVTNPPEPILEAQARAALVAGIRAVDYVVLTEDDPASGELAQSAIHEEQADTSRLEELVELVRARHGKRT